MENSLATKIEEANRVLFKNGNLDKIGDFFTPDYTVHLTNRNLKGGHKIVQDILSSLRKSFDDIKVDVEILLDSESRIAWQRTLRGKHSKSFKNFPASGLEIVWRDMVISEFRDGLIAEEWVVTDLAEQLLMSRKRKF